MSDVANLSRLAPAVSQLPVDWYFDQSIHELEKKLIFDAGPGYVGHQLMVPEAGNYRSLEWKDHGQMLLSVPAPCSMIAWRWRQTLDIW